MSEKEVHSVRHYRKWGYEVRDETHLPVGGGGPKVRFKSAYTPSGDYIGDPKIARLLCAKRGIRPELRTPPSGVCSIGFSVEENKWYGWSHRALFGFGVGDEVKEGDCCASSGWSEEYLAEHPEEDTSLPVGFKAKNFEDAKRMAIAFAASVS